MQPTRFIEVDFADVTRRKVAAIQAIPQLHQPLDDGASIDTGTGAPHNRHPCKYTHHVLSHGNAA